MKDILIDSYCIIINKIIYVNNVYMVVDYCKLLEENVVLVVFEWFMDFEDCYFLYKFINIIMV